MKREIIRVEPLSTYILSGVMRRPLRVTRHGDTIYVSCLPAL